MRGYREEILLRIGNGISYQEAKYYEVNDEANRR